jgi:arylsulfatase A-like enzyme
VVSDHGFSTQAGTDAPLRQVLAPFRDDIVEAGGAVHILLGGEQRRQDIVGAVQGSPAVGAVFTRGVSARAMLGQDEGTLSFASIGWEHARNSDVMFSANWSHDRNRDGVAGTTALPGAAGHGTTSPYDIRATFLVAGRGIRKGDSTFVPTSNRDIAPTVLTLLGLPVPSAMTGRPLRELMRDGPALRTVNVTRSEVTATAASGYTVTLYRSSVDSVEYVDSTVVRRRPAR